MGLRDTGLCRCRVRGVMMSAKTDQSVMIVMIGSQGNCHKLITPTAGTEGKGCPKLFSVYLHFYNCDTLLNFSVSFQFL